jgi:hypothetical protein
MFTEGADFCLDSVIAGLDKVDLQEDWQLLDIMEY